MPLRNNSQSILPTPLAYPADTSCPHRLPHGDKYIAVHLLTRQSLNFAVNVKCKVKDLYECVCNALRISGDFQCLFGLACLIDGEFRFLDPEQKLLKVAPKAWRLSDAGLEPMQSSASGSAAAHVPCFAVFFRVQIYVDYASLIKDHNALLHYYLQLRENVVQYWDERIVLEERCFEVAALALQAEYGDYMPSCHRTGYFLANLYFPLWVINNRGLDFITRSMPEMHRDYQGLSVHEAQLQFCREVSRQPTAVNCHVYGLRRHKQDCEDNALLSISARGVDVLERKRSSDQPQHVASFLWPKLSKVAFDRRRFTLADLSGAHMQFFTSSDEKSKYLLWFCKAVHQGMFKVHARAVEARRDELRERKPYREKYVYSDQADLEFVQYHASQASYLTYDLASQQGGQRVSMVSDVSSNTTSGIVSDRHNTHDESELEPDDFDLDVVMDSSPLVLSELSLSPRSATGSAPPGASSASVEGMLGLVNCQSRSSYGVLLSSVSVSCDVLQIHIDEEPSILLSGVDNEDVFAAAQNAENSRQEERTKTPDAVSSTPREEFEEDDKDAKDASTSCSDYTLTGGCYSDVDTRSEATSATVGKLDDFYDGESMHALDSEDQPLSECGERKHSTASIVDNEDSRLSELAKQAEETIVQELSALLLRQDNCAEVVSAAGQPSVIIVNDSPHNSLELRRPNRHQKVGSVDIAALREKTLRESDRRIKDKSVPQPPQLQKISNELPVVRSPILGLKDLRHLYLAAEKEHQKPTTSVVDAKQEKMLVETATQTTEDIVVSSHEQEPVASAVITERKATVDIQPRASLGDLKFPPRFLAAMLAEQQHLSSYSLSSLPLAASSPAASLASMPSPSTSALQAIREPPAYDFVMRQKAATRTGRNAALHPRWTTVEGIPEPVAAQLGLGQGPMQRLASVPGGSPGSLSSPPIEQAVRPVLNETRELLQHAGSEPGLAAPIQQQSLFEQFLADIKQRYSAAEPGPSSSTKATLTTSPGNGQYVKAAQAPLGARSKSGAGRLVSKQIGSPGNSCNAGGGASAGAGSGISSAAGNGANNVTVARTHSMPEHARFMQLRQKYALERCQTHAATRGPVNIQQQQQQLPAAVVNNNNGAVQQSAHQRGDCNGNTRGFCDTCYEEHSAGRPLDMAQLRVLSEQFNLPFIQALCADKMAAATPPEQSTTPPPRAPRPVSWQEAVLAQATQQQVAALSQQERSPPSYAQLQLPLFSLPTAQTVNPYAGHYAPASGAYFPLAQERMNAALLLAGLPAAAGGRYASTPNLMYELAPPPPYACLQRNFVPSRLTTVYDAAS